MKAIKTSIIQFLSYTVLLGAIYPAIVTVIGQLLFYENTIGSPIASGAKLVGSEFIGQEFKESKYFSSRPSAISSWPYNPESSSGSNLALSNPAFQQQLKDRAQLWSHGAVPVDLVTASGSGLDPEISIAAAKYQVKRIATERGISEEKILMLITSLAKNRVLGFLGEPRVNVLLLNMELDRL
ncbi:potassium-transporting ATPase subunit KdpC [bacterium]|nr:potassium-transporting ATPase subunit KdpC [bacterium]